MPFDLMAFSSLVEHHKKEKYTHKICEAAIKIAEVVFFANRSKVTRLS